MTLKHISKEEAVHASVALKQALDTIIQIGEYTQENRKAMRQYVNIIIEIGSLRGELRRHADGTKF